METLEWALVEEHLRADTPWLLSMGGTRDVRIGFDPSKARMYARLPVSADTPAPLSALAQLDVELRHDYTGPILELSTSSGQFYRQFHGFVGLLTEAFEQPRETALGAFSLALRKWRNFTSERTILSPEQQLGLMGELLLLDALIAARGPGAITTWIGRCPTISSRHDFRLAGVDLEVKSTRSPTRQHIIHGMLQLVPAIGHSLYLLSLRLEPAGISSGHSLAQQVQRLRARLPDATTVYRLEFEARLSAAGYKNEDAPCYGEKFRLADRPRLIAVDDGCPRVVPSILMSALHPDTFARLSDVVYRVNLEGLGVAEGSEEYGAVLGAITLEMV